MERLAQGCSARPRKSTTRKRDSKAERDDGSGVCFFCVWCFWGIFFEDTNIFGICLMCFCFCAFFGSLIVVFGSFVKEVATVRWGL